MDIPKNFLSHIHVLNNEVVTIDGVNFFGSTLWTDFNLFGDVAASQAESQRYMNDYYYITSTKTGKNLMPTETAQAFGDSKLWLENALSDNAGKTNVVVTYHAPSIRSILPQYLDDKATAAFASNLDDFVLHHQPDVWIHGHVHNQVDCLIGKTRVLCNPRGYPGEEIRKYFDPTASFIIS